MYKHVLKSGSEVETIYPVHQEIVVGHLNILLLMKPNGGTPNDNVICFTKSGEKQWVIEPFVPVPGDQNPYMSVADASNGQLTCSTWKGVDVVVDVETGKIAGVLKRRPW